MKELVKYLNSIGADEYFSKMNLSLNELFENEHILSNPYTEHNWELRENAQYTVINAIPDNEKQDRLFWEEWFVADDGIPHHHIITLWKPDKFDEIFDSPESDDIHPALSFGKRWYVVEDTDMTPLLLRR